MLLQIEYYEGRIKKCEHRLNDISNILHQSKRKTNDL